jgi:hypothetical protein
MRRRYDPRELQKALEERNAAARDAAAKFGAALAAGELGPAATDLVQGEPRTAAPSLGAAEPAADGHAECAALLWMSLHCLAIQ